jgi:hypothetical protein
VRACVAEITTPAYKGPFARGVVARKKQVDGVMQRGLLVKRVVHAVAVETTTHPVGARHVKNNMALALLSSHCPPVVHPLHARLQERNSFEPALRIRRGTRQRGRVVLQNRTHGFQARIPPA